MLIIDEREGTVTIKDADNTDKPRDFFFLNDNQTGMSPIRFEANDTDGAWEAFMGCEELSDGEKIAQKLRYLSQGWYCIRFMTEVRA